MCKNGDACRPLHASWVNGKAYAVAGEGSHAEIAVKVRAGYLPRYKGRVTATEVQLVQFADALFENMHPFETRWTTERVALWQPNTARFYKLEDVPTKRQFELAQEQFSLDMGTPDKARDWILAAAELYGKDELPMSPAQYLRFDQPLYIATLLVLKEDCRDISLTRWSTPVGVEEANAKAAGPRWTVPNEKFFDEWAERFSERKNRIPLWAN